MPDVSPTQANNKYLSLLRSATTTIAATATTTIAAANIYNNQQEATLAANVWLQVAFWAKPHSQLIATTTPTAITTATKSSWQQLPVAGAQKCGLGRNTAAAWRKRKKLN